jgi:hypothetical protein
MAQLAASRMTPIADFDTSKEGSQANYLRILVDLLA